MAVPSASVVLIEDSLPYARLVELLLADAVPGGVEVRHHMTLAAGMADLRARRADCALLDLSLPDATGIEAVSAVVGAGLGVPVVVLSGHDDDELAMETIRAGAQEYLVKGQERPPQRFVRAIRFAIERARARERAEDLLRAREDRWRTLTHMAPVGIVELAADGRCLFANERVAELCGTPPAGARVGDRFGFESAWAAAVAGGGEFAVEARFAAPGSGEPRWTHVTGVPVRDPGGTAAGWLGTLVDVTPARRAREELRRHQQDVLALVALAREASVAEDPVDALCAGARTVLGALEVEMKAAGGADASAAAVLEQVVSGGSAAPQVLHVRWSEAEGAAGAGRRTLVELLAAELGAALERRELLERLRELARTDPLTGVANRRLWDERLAIELARAERYGRPLCVAAIDLDRFKPYNDRFGHHAGDALLREASTAWRGALRAADLLARLGGDEFALLLPDCDVGCARGIVDRLRVLTPGGEEGVGCSAGLVCWESGEAGDAVLARADEALYAAKAAGRGGVELG